MDGHYGKMDWYLRTVIVSLFVFNKSNVMQYRKYLRILLYILNSDVVINSLFGLAAVLRCIVAMSCVLIGSNIVRSPRKPRQRLLPWASVHCWQHRAVRM